MLLKLKSDTGCEVLKKLEHRLNEHGLHHCVSSTHSEVLIGLEKPISSEVLNDLQTLGCVVETISIDTPWKLASKAFKKEKTKITIKGVTIGGPEVILMAGPCAIESEEQLRSIAQQLSKAKVKVFRGSAFKPRTSPYSFQGMGVEGLRLHKMLQEEHGMLIETEVMDVRDVEIVAEHIDIVRIGARNMQNFNLLKEVGRCGKPVILKRGISATVEEWLMSAEYLMAHGNHQVILCETGYPHL